MNILKSFEEISGPTASATTTAKEAGRRRFDNQFYLILSNIGKRNNFGALIRTATAFGVEKVLVVGESKQLKTFGNQGTVQYVDFQEFKCLKTLKDWCEHEEIDVLGVEIVDQATNIVDFSEDIKVSPRRGIALMLGNEGIGMSDKQKEICDEFVYISQFGRSTASLNVATAGGIIMHHLAECRVDRIETSRTNEKYDVDPRPSKKERFMNVERMEKVRAKRQREREDKAGGTHEGANLIELNEEA